MLGTIKLKAIVVAAAMIALMLVAAPAQARSDYVRGEYPLFGELSSVQGMPVYTTKPAASYYTPQALKALGDRGKAMSRVYAERGYVRGEYPLFGALSSAQGMPSADTNAPDATAAGRSFRWDDFAIGAAFAVGGFVLLAAAAGALRTRRMTPAGS
jgi:hypothetical protein